MPETPCTTLIFKREPMTTHGLLIKIIAFFFRVKVGCLKSFIKDVGVCPIFVLILQCVFAVVKNCWNSVSFFCAPADSTNYRTYVSNYPSTWLANQTMAFLTANHGAYSNLHTQLGARTGISALARRLSSSCFAENGIVVNNFKNVRALLKITTLFIT